MSLMIKSMMNNIKLVDKILNNGLLDGEVED